MLKSERKDKTDAEEDDRNAAMQRSCRVAAPSHHQSHQTSRPEANTPRKLVKIHDPTVPSEGTRPTYFTGLSTRSFESIKSLSRKPFLENYMTIRVKPAKLVVLDYESGSQQECILTIVNYSKKVQYLSLGDTTTRLFKLAKDAPLSEFSIAPGLEKKIKVIFTAPFLSECNASDSLSKLYLDRLEIQVRDGKSISVPMEAFPPASKLEFSTAIDFGTLQRNDQQAKEWESFGKNSQNRIHRSQKKEYEAMRKEKFQSGWVKKKFALTTLGKRPAHFSFEFDQSKPIKITPMSAVLEGDSCMYITVEYLPIFAGQVDEKIRIRLENNVPSPNERMGSKNLAHIMMKGIVIDRKVHLSTPSGLDVLGPGFLDFGSVYFGQAVYLPVQIKNQDSKRVHWTLSHYHKNQSNVPRILKWGSRDAIHSNDSNEQAFTAVPSEGILEPGQGQTIKIAFNPIAPTLQKKFKSHPLPVESKSYNLVLKLQTLQMGPSNGPQSQEAPIDLHLKGTGLPFLLQFSQAAVTFLRNDESRMQEKTIRITNGNTELGVKFAFEKVAHFGIEPSFGHLLPLEAIDLTITFRPNQYGHFQLISKCIATPFMSHAHGIDNSENLIASELVLLGENHLSNLDLTLAGSWLPSILPKNLSSGNLIDKAQDHGQLEEITVKPSTVEWKKKVAHRQMYVDYIRGKGAHKPRTREAIKSLNQTASVLHYLDDERLRPNSADQRTGLVPPEPIAKGLTARYQLKSRSGAAAESCESAIGKEQHAIQLQKDFLKLVVHSALKPKHFSEIGLHPHWYEEMLSSEDLSHIYASASILDFGEVTVHSITKLPLNFLNATPSRTPIHLSHLIGGDSKNTDVSFISISPAAVKIGVNDVGGLDIVLNPHVAGNLSINMCYIINKRYVYHVLLKAVITGIDVKCSTARLDMCIVDADLFSKKQEDKPLEKAIADDRFLDQEVGVPQSLIENYRTRINRFVNGKEYKFPCTEATFTLTNPGNYRAYFELSDSQNLSVFPEIELLQTSTVEGAFLLEPMSGYVEANSTVHIKVKYVPGTKTFSDRVYFVSIYDCFDGKKLLLKKMNLSIHGSTEPSSAQLLFNPKQGPLDFGILPLSSKEDPSEYYDPTLTWTSKNPAVKFPIFGVKTVKIKNEGVFSHVFVAFATERGQEIDISPHCGILTEDQTLELTISILPTSTGVVEDEIIFNLIGGGKSFKIPIKYDCRKPNLEFNKLGSSAFAPKVILDSSTLQTYSVFNKGSVFARLIFDLSRFPEFSVVAKEDKSRNNPSGFTRKPSNNTLRILSATQKSFRLAESRTGSAMANSSSLTTSLHRIGRIPQKHIYVVDSQPGDRFLVDLTYNPTTLDSFVDPIPVTLLGTKISLNFETNITSIPSPLRISEKELWFDEKIIHPDGKGKSLSVKFLEMENFSEKSISWNATVSNNQSNYSDSTAFAVTIKSGQIDAGEKHKMEITFDPANAGLYSSILNVGIDYMNSDAVIPVKMTGTALKPSIHFEPQEVFFPIVPLGETSQAVFWIWNFGCDSGDIIAEIPPEIKRPDIQFDLSFPEGRFLKDYGSIPCLVKFTAKSRKPISFTIRIPFQDPESSRYYLTMHGTSDFSDITTVPYSLNPSFSSPARASPKFYLIKREFKTPGGTVLSAPEKRVEFERIWKYQFENIGFWLNESFGLHIESFPGTLITSQGAPLYNLISFLAGKKVSSLLPSPKVQSVDAKHALRHYNELLNFLTIHGALLSNVKAEFLLSAEDYKSLTFSPESQKQRSFRIEHSEVTEVEENYKHFSLVSVEAWSCLILQVLRIFLFPATSCNLVKSLSDDDQVDIQLILQGQFSSHPNATDATLLAWVGSVLKKETGFMKSFKKFATALNDSVIYKALLLHHVPASQKAFAHFVNVPQSDEHKLTNALAVKKALVSVFGEAPWSDFKEKLIVGGSELDHRFLVLFLFQTLPFFIPKSEIEFNGQLHQQQTRYIEISNPSSKTAVYTATLVGAKEFQIQDTTFNVPPKSSYNFQISFKSRFARQSEGVVTIKTKKCILGASNILSFKLFAVASILEPIQTVYAEAPLYSVPPLAVKVEIKNPFPEAANFRLHLSQVASFYKTAGFSNLDLKGEKSETSNFNIPAPFTLTVDTLQVSAGKSQELQIYFLPFDLGDQNCSVIFHDPEVGEFMINVKGTGLIPAPVEQTSFIGTSGTPIEKVIRLSPSNSLRERAIHTCVNLNYSTGYNSASRSRSGSGRDKSKSFGERDSYQLPKQNLKYQVEYLSPFITGPNQVVIKAPPSSEKGKITTITEQLHSELPVTFSPPTSGKYACQILLSCSDCVDYRLFVINCLARSEGSKADLEFKVQAMRFITQDIPIINQTEEDWPIRAVLSGDYFSAPFMITAKAGQVTMFPIVFRPRKRCLVSGNLSLFNSCTNQKYTYNLKGTGLEPDPEDYIQIACSCREKQELHLTVTNDTNTDATYDVITDIPVLKGERTVTVAAGLTLTYDMEFMSLHSGSFSKFIKFYNPADESFSWYSVEMHVVPAPPDYTLSLDCVIRETKAADILLKNPLVDRSITYQVASTGNYLSGLKEITIPANGEINYNLEYSPLTPGSYMAYVKFSNSAIGEFSYEIKLTAHDAKPKILDFIECPLGKSKSILVEISNPLDSEVILDAKVGNPSNFQVFIPPIVAPDLPMRSHELTKKILLGPHQRVPAHLVYWPSGVGDINETLLEFTNPSLGSIAFSCKAVGTDPVDMRPVVIVCPMGDSKGGTVEFENPFMESAQIEISLEQSQKENAFSLVNNSKSRFVGGLEVSTIQITYKPTHMGKSKASLIIEATNQKYKWVYPIEGLPEVQGLPINLKSKVREKTDHIAEVQISSLPFIKADKGKKVNWSHYFKMDLVGNQASDRRWLENVLAIKVLETTVTDSTTLTLKVMFQFLPSKLLDAKVHLSFTNLETGSLWKFPINMVALTPHIDDTIIIQGDSKKVSTVCFNLKNPYERPLNFKAYFHGKKQPVELSVSPTDGTLAPSYASTETSNQFFVSFTPHVNGKSANAMLIVETDEFALFYEIKGITPLVRSIRK